VVGMILTGLFIILLVATSSSASFNQSSITVTDELIITKKNDFKLKKSDLFLPLILSH
jgi:hypothetical protein